MILLRAFDIRKGEAQRALLMQLYIFLVISTLLMIKPTVQSLFLSSFGIEQLPLAYVMVALVAAGVSLLYARSLRLYSFQSISGAILVLSILCLLLFGLLLYWNVWESFTLYLFYIWVAIFALLATSQFWVLANMIFTTREAKRLFSFVGAGAIAGGIFGGYLALLLVDSLGSEKLPFICALLLSFCIPINRKLWRQYVTPVIPPFERKQKLPRDSQHPWQLIRASKHLTYVAYIVGISVMVSKLVDYQFGGLAAAQIPDPDELTAFFAFWFSTFNVLSLLLQLFLTQRLVGTFGVGTSMFFLPFLLLIAAFCLIVFPELLWAAVGLKLVDGSLKQSINKAAMELIVMPIDAGVKRQTKTFIDVFIDSLATGLVGLLLIFIIKGLALPDWVVTLMILLLLGVWCYFAYRVRLAYLSTFRLKLQEVSRSRKKELRFDLGKHSVLNGWRRVLEKGEEPQRLFILSYLLKHPDQRMFSSIRMLLQAESEVIQEAAIRNLTFLNNEDLSEEIRVFIQHPKQRLKIAAFEYLLHWRPKEQKELLKLYLEDQAIEIQAAALVSMAKSLNHNSDLEQQFLLDQRIEGWVKALDSLPEPAQVRLIKISLAKAIGYAHFSTYYHLLRQYLRDPDPLVQKAAIAAAGSTVNVFFINDLLQLLGQGTAKAEVIQALALYKDGLIGIVKEQLQQHAYPPEVVRAIPLILEKIERQLSVDLLFQLLEHEDAAGRWEALRSLNQLRSAAPHLRFNPKIIARKILDEAKGYQSTLGLFYAQMKIENEQHTVLADDVIGARKALIGLLDKRLARNLERIFLLLGLKYPPDDILQIYDGLNSKDANLHANAIEFLDTLLEPSMKKVLVPLIETTMLETVSEEAIRMLKLKEMGEEECFQMLLHGKDVRLKLATLYLIFQLGNAKYLPLLRPLLNHHNETVRHNAAKTIARLEMNLH